MPERVFSENDSLADSAGRAAVAAYFERLRMGEPFSVQCEALESLPYPVDEVWQIVLETQHLGTWLEDGEFADAPIPERFHRGFCINAARGPTYLLDCEQKRHLRSNQITFQRQFYIDRPAIYFTIIVSPDERYSSKVSIRAQDPALPNRLGRTLVKIFGSGQSDYATIATRELTERLKKAVKRFRNLCWDRVHCGPTHRDYAHAGRWTHWHASGDVVKYYANKTGHLGPEIGEFVGSGERIGFVQGLDDGLDVSYWKDSHYIEPGTGYVCQVHKRHEDRISYGDRIILLGQQNADFNIAAVNIEFIDFAVRSSTTLDQYAVKVGQAVHEGDLIATLRDSDGRTTYSVASKYEGTVTELTKSSGESIGKRLPWDYVAKMKVRPISSSSISAGLTVSAMKSVGADISHDVFISHASEDKAPFVRPLAEALKAAGIRLWYDEFQLDWGSGLRESIDRGLAQSRYGIVVLSHSFFAKEWPQRELNGLFATTKAGQRRILPIWHDIGVEDLKRYSPMLADLLALRSSDGVEAIVQRVVAAVREGQGA